MRFSNVKKMPVTLGHTYEGVYSRHDDQNVLKKHEELQKQVYKLTGSCITDKGIWKVVRRKKEDSEQQCMCSCYELLINFIVEHEPSGIKFSIGSKCIEVFQDTELTRELNYFKRGAPTCVAGKPIRDLRTANGRKEWCDDDMCSCRPCPDCTLSKFACVCKRCVECNRAINWWKTQCEPCWKKKQAPKRKACVIEEE